MYSLKMNNIRILCVVTIVAILYSVQLARAQSGEISDGLQCVQRLMPCQPYIHSVDTPPQWCCDPMKEIAEKNKTCLCTAFNHPEMLRLIDLTKENALNLLTSCGASFDESFCSKTATTAPGSMANGSSSSSTRSNAAIAISLLVSSFISAYMGF